MKETSSLPYSVVSCFMDYQGQVLLLKRAKQDSQCGLWGILGGKVDEGETPEQALIREAKEEIALDIGNQDLDFICKAPMKNQCDGSYLLYIYYTKFEDPVEVTLNGENSEYDWTSLDQFKDYPLLFCQGQAFDLAHHFLKQKIGSE